MAPTDVDIDALLRAPEVWRGGGHALRDLFIDAGAHASDDEALRTAVEQRLTEQPHFIESWQLYSYDKRSTPNPYIDELEVGHYDAGYRHVRTHLTAASACADFVLREVRWVTERRVVESE